MAKKIKKLGKKKETNIAEETEAQLKIMYWFFSYPTIEMSLSDLSNELRISKTTANQVVQKLEEKGFLEKKVIGRSWRIKALLNPDFFIRKIPYNLSLVYESGILNNIYEKYPNARTVILFGSYRKGDDIETSDLDIAVEVLDNQEMRIEKIGVIPQLGYRRNVPVTLHVFSRNKIDLNLFSNIVNGVILGGFLEARP